MKNAFTMFIKYTACNNDSKSNIIFIISKQTDYVFNHHWETTYWSLDALSKIYKTKENYKKTLSWIQ